MGELKTEDRNVVVPGEVLAVGMDFLPSHGTYRQDDKILASRLGLTKVDGKVIKIIPLSGVYAPKRNDTIICQVTDVLISGWRVSTFCSYSAVLPLKDATSEYIQRGADLTKYYAIGDYVSCKVTNVTSQKLIDVTMRGPGLRKIEGGRILTVNCYKVPRIIGKQGSMVSMIKNATGCKIMVGQNGIVWVSGEPAKEVIAVDTIKMIEKNSHVAGLTDKVKAHLEKKTGVKVEMNVETKKEQGE